MAFTLIDFPMLITFNMYTVLFLPILFYVKKDFVGKVFSLF